MNTEQTMQVIDEALQESIDAASYTLDMLNAYFERLKILGYEADAQGFQSELQAVEKQAADIAALMRLKRMIATHEVVNYRHKDSAPADDKKEMLVRDLMK